MMSTKNSTSLSSYGINEKSELNKPTLILRGNLQLNIVLHSMSIKNYLAKTLKKLVNYNKSLGSKTSLS